METSFNQSIKCEENNFKFEIDLSPKENPETLIIKLSSPNQFYPIIYTKSFSLQDIQKVSNYFSSLPLPEILSKICQLIKAEKYSLKRNELNPSNLILKLYPSYLEMSGENITDIEFEIPLEKNEKNLYEIIADMSLKINELSEKVKKLEQEQATKNQISECDKKIEKINIKLNRINKLHIYQDSNFLNRIQAVMSKNILLNGDEFDLLKYFINITLVKTEEGIRFGGYTTKTWNKDQECKQDDEAFLFSINLRKKYEIKKGVECAIYCGGEYGPTFGEGFDLCLCDNFMGVNGSYSNFPKSYGKGSSTNELTEYNKNFKVSDVEVYLVSFY